MPAAGGSSHEGGLGSQHTRLGVVEVDGSRSVSILLDEATMVLGPRSRVDCSPAVLTVVAETVDVPTKIWSITATTVNTVTLITQLIVQYIWLNLHL